MDIELLYKTLNFRINDYYVELTKDIDTAEVICWITPWQSRKYEIKFDKGEFEKLSTLFDKFFKDDNNELVDYIKENFELWINLPDWRKVLC